MITAYVPDVGDGLVVGFVTLADLRVQIDCGSSRTPELAAEKGLASINPEVFFLSHFHTDHYNGLFPRGRHRPRRQRIEQVYFPRVPEFAEKREFMLCLLSVANRTFGHVTGSMEADFLRSVSRINACAFGYRALSQGDRVQMGGSEMEVLWPPRAVDGEETVAAVRRAILDFQVAKKEDPELSNIYECLADSGNMHPYIDPENKQGEFPGRAEEQAEMRARNDEEKNLPEPTRKANVSLREAANHFSLALRRDDRFLFMGDLEGASLGTVVADLASRRATRYLAIVSPHHGTKWHESMNQLRASWVITSVGEGLISKVVPRLKSIGRRHHITYLCGDLEVPVSGRWWPCFARYGFPPFWP